MLISGIQKFTMLDYPDKTACIVFTPGCNFRCGYCHNPEFVLPEKIAELRTSFIPEEHFFRFLETRAGVKGQTPLLDGVVITGGEPTLMPDLRHFMSQIKEMGMLVKLDTNGNRPEVLETALRSKLVDYIAMDFKTSLGCYADLVGKLVKPENIAKSISIIQNSGIEYEFRSTLVQEIHTDTVLHTMAAELAGAKRLYLQRFRSGTTLKQVFRSYTPYTAEQMERIKNIFSPHVKEVAIR